MQDILERLRVDSGRKTLGDLIQEREAAANEIERLRRLVASVGPRRASSPKTLPKVEAPAIALARRAIDPQALLRLSDVCALVGLSRSTIYNLLAESQFPAPVRVSVRAVRWRAAEVLDWIDARRGTMRE